MGYAIFVLLIAVLAFLFGARHGRKKAKSDAALGEAWQKGYDSANSFWQSRTGQQRPSGPPMGAPEGSAQPSPASPSMNLSELEDRYSAAETGVADTEIPDSETRKIAAAANPDVGALPFMRRPLAENTTPTAAAPQTPDPIKVGLSPRARELRNINITLYVAALLLVAAGALFLSFALPPLAKLVGLCLVSVAFYAGGLITHRAKPTLRPAAAAFAGTGLALLPLTAIATYNTIEISGISTWLLFSLLGTAAFGYATIKLRSRILAWLAVLILISTAMSGGAVVQEGVFAYLVALLALSVVLQLLLLRSQRLRDSIFQQALATSVTLLPPLVFLAALVMFFDLSSRELFWTFLLLCTHYLMTTRLQSQARGRNFAAARFFAMLSMVAALAYLHAKLHTILLVLIVMLVAQAVLMSVSGPRYRKAFGVGVGWYRIERICLWGTGLALTMALYPIAGGQADATWWVSLILIPAVLGALIWVVSRRAGYLEATLLPTFAAVTTFENVQDWWRPLPALVLAVIGLSLVVGGKPRRIARIASQLRWLLLLLIGAKLAQSLHVITGGSTFTQFFPALVGFGAVTGLLLLRNLKVLRSPLRAGPVRNHYLARVLASVVVLLLVAGQTRLWGEEPARPGNFLGLQYGAWSLILLLVTTLVVIALGWANERLAERPEIILRVSTLSSLVLLFALALREDYWWLAPLVALVHLLFLGGVLLRMDSSPWKIAYAGLAQVNFTGAIWWTVSHFELDAHGQLAVLMLSLLLPQGMRLARDARRGARIGQEKTLITVGLLVLLPLVLTVYSLELSRADRGTLMLGLGAWLGYAVLAHHALKHPQYRQWLRLPVNCAAVALTMVPAAAMNPQTGWLRTTLWGESTVHWLLTALVVIAVLREYLQRRELTHAQQRLVALALPLVALFAYQSSLGWAAFTLLLTALACGVLVHSRGQAWFALPASVVGLAACYAGWRAMAGGSLLPADKSLDFSWAMVAGGLILLVIALLHGRFGEPEPDYVLRSSQHTTAAGGAARIYYAAMLGAGVLAGVNAHLLHREPLPVLGGAALLLVVLVVIRLHEISAVHGHHATDVLMLVAAALGVRSYDVLFQAVDPVAAVLFFAAVTAALSLRHLRVRRELSTGWMIGAAVLGSIAEIGSLTGTNAVVQMLILVFFAGLLAYGLFGAQKLFTWWAALAITAAVVWFLRDYAFVLLALLAAGLIALAIIKLMKVEKSNK